MAPEADRFAFGENWRRFLSVIDEGRIAAAEQSLLEMLGPISGSTFLDVGCGSGLFSLAAARLGARVRSFDFDQEAVACANELRQRYDVAGSWEIGQGSILDGDFLRQLGKWDVVYSWGVLHHTGQMATAISNAASLVSAGGRFYISIYNDQGAATRVWTQVKQTYVRSPRLVQVALVMAVIGYLGLRPSRWVRRFIERQSLLPTPPRRGMSWWHDMVDWVGGYPFEVAKPEAVIEPLLADGFALARLRTVGGGLGCNEFVFRRSTPAPV